jgi:hypothetical protein
LRQSTLKRNPIAIVATNAKKVTHYSFSGFLLIDRAIPESKIFRALVQY